LFSASVALANTGLQAGGEAQPVEKAVSNGFVNDNADFDVISG
jgi:hypothetical protein